MIDLGAKYAMKNTKKEDVLHTSGFAQVQSGTNMGAASTASFEVRQAVRENRKHLQGYRNSHLRQNALAVQRARTYTPRVEGAAGVARGRGTLSADNPALFKHHDSTLSSTSNAGSPIANHLAARPSITSGRANTPAFAPPRRTPPIR